jgi:DNA-binding SARP family transcriptional activator
MASQLRNADLPAQERAKISTFGEFSVTAPDGTVLVDDRHGRKADVLKYLVCRRGVLCDPRAVAAALWPDSTAQAAASNLRVAIHHIKKLLTAKGFAPMLRCNGTLSLDLTMLTVDAWQTEERVGELLHLDDANASEFLTELDALNLEPFAGDAYVEWCAEYRAWLQSLKRRVMLRLLDAWGRGLLSAQQARSLERSTYKFALEEPGDPDIIPAFIAILAAANRRVEAIELRRRFVEEDGDDSQLPAIRATDRQQRATRAPRVVAGASWVHRAECTADENSRDVAALGDALDLAMDGVGQCIVVHSDDEILRTAVVEEILVEAEDREALVCDIVVRNDLSATLLNAFERMRASLTFSADEFPDIVKHFERLAKLNSEYLDATSGHDVTRAIAFEFSSMLRSLAKCINLVVSVDNAERLDLLGAGFLSQLLLLSRWSGMFLVLRVSLGEALHTPVGDLVESLRGAVPFLAIEERKVSALQAVLKPSAAPSLTALVKAAYTHPVAAPAFAARTFAGTQAIGY